MNSEILYRRIATKEGYTYEPVYPIVDQVSHDGIYWEPRKQEPYQPFGLELLKCTIGVHELVESKKYAHTKYCFRCGKRKTNPKYAY